MSGVATRQLLLPGFLPKPPHHGRKPSPQAGGTVRSRRFVALHVRLATVATSLRIAATCDGSYTTTEPADSLRLAHDWFCGRYRLHKPGAWLELERPRRGGVEPARDFRRGDDHAPQRTPTTRTRRGLGRTSRGSAVERLHRRSDQVAKLPQRRVALRRSVEPVVRPGRKARKQRRAAFPKQCENLRRVQVDVTRNAFEPPGAEQGVALRS